MPDPKVVYQVVVQIEGTVQEPINFWIYESAVQKADRVASESNRETDDVRVFEFNPETMKSVECYVPEMQGDKTPERP